MPQVRPVLVAIALCPACLCAGFSPASANLLINGGFEAPVLASGDAVTFAPGQTVPLVGGAWTVVGIPGTSIYLLQTNYAELYNDVSMFNAEEGFNSLDISGPSNQGPTAGIQQTVTVTPGQQYVLSFFVGRVTPNAGPGGVYPSPATVDVSIDGGPRQSFTNSNITNGRINWRQFYLTFTPTGSTATIAFLNGTPPGSNETGLDNVVLVANGATGVGDTPSARALYLSEPQPNPAHDATTLRYSLSRAEPVQLAVYDVAGHRVHLLRDERQAAGVHSATFMARDDAGHALVSGVYFVRLEAGGQALTRKLLVVK